MSSAVHTGLVGGVQRINNSPLDCLEHNDRIAYIHCCISFLIAYNAKCKKRFNDF